VTTPPNHAETRALLQSLGRLIRQLTRITGGPEPGPAMTSTQRLALFELATGAGPLRLNDLADLLATTPPTASRAVDALVELGFVRRQPDPDDRRAVQVDVTPKGRRYADAREARATEAFAPALAKLSIRERAALADVLERLADSLRP
jgi:DNA-binding MarR family transcriptional regulator